MHRRISPLIILLVSIVCFTPAAAAQKKRPPKNNPPPPPIVKVEPSAELGEVIFDKDTVFLYCPSRISEDLQLCPKRKQVIKIAATVKNAGDKSLTYYYLVSGGRINSQGANVEWDFDNSRLGKYTITVGIGNGGVLHGKTITKTIEVKECPVCDLPCECPNISISGPTEPAAPGDSMIFEANVSGGSQSLVEYHWTISSGTITSGQGTPRIIVQVPAETTAESITATVEVAGLCVTCRATASETGAIKRSKP